MPLFFCALIFFLVHTVFSHQPQIFYSGLISSVAIVLCSCAWVSHNHRFGWGFLFLLARESKVNSRFGWGGRLTILIFIRLIWANQKQLFLKEIEKAHQIWLCQNCHWFNSEFLKAACFLKIFFSHKFMSCLPEMHPRRIYKL